MVCRRNDNTTTTRRALVVDQSWTKKYDCFVWAFILAAIITMFENAFVKSRGWRGSGPISYTLPDLTAFIDSFYDITTLVFVAAHTNTKHATFQQSPHACLGLGHGCTA